MARTKPGPGGGTSTEGKARYRARASGMGIYGLIRRLRIRTWAEIEPVATPVCGFAFSLTDLRVTGQRTLVASIIAPIEYLQEMGELVLETEHSFGWLNAFVVPRNELLSEADLDAESGGDGDDSD